MFVNRLIQYMFNIASPTTVKGMVSSAVVIVVSCMSAMAGDPEVVRDRLKNDPFMVPFYTGKILPRPQEASYGQHFYPLDHTGIVIGQDVSRDDPRLKILLGRIAQYGGQHTFVDSADNDCSTIIAVGDTEYANGLKVPAKPQGYAIKCYRNNGKNVVAFNGRDRLGLLWAVNSLVQMITLRDDQTVLHAVDVQDFPFMVKRGTYGPDLHYGNETFSVYPVMTKFDWMVLSGSLLVVRADAPKDAVNWRKLHSGEGVHDVAAMGATLSELGIHWQASILPFRTSRSGSMALQLRCGNDEDFAAVWTLCEPALKAGGGICLDMGDWRFPIHEDDKTAFGSAQKADAHFINRLYEKMMGSYPEADMSIAQPFSHGPRTFYHMPGVRNPWDGESPIEYLTTLGDRVPKAIGIRWTGTQVETSGFTAKDVERMAALVQRKPYFLQNGTDSGHMHEFVYPTDALDWWLNRGRDIDVYRQVDGAMFQSEGLYADMLWSAMLWNPNGYDAEEAAYQATCKIMGNENYDLARKLADTLGHFDRYVLWGDLWSTRKAARRIAEMEQHLRDARAFLNQVEGSNRGAAVRRWKSVAEPLRVVEDFCKAVKEKERYELYLAAAGQEQRARQDGACRTDDIFVAACDFGGGKLDYVSPSLSDDERPAMILSGSEPIATAEAEMPDGSSGQSFTVLISGKCHDDMAENSGANGFVNNDRQKGDGEMRSPKLLVYLNGSTVFEGKPPFESTGWMVKSFPSDGVTIQQGEKNFLCVMIVDDASEQDANVKYSTTPVFSVNYAVIRLAQDRNEK